MNVIRAIATSIAETATWAETLIITAGWAVVFGFLSLCGLLTGADLNATVRYFCGTMSCALASALVISIIHGALIAYRRIVAFERREARRRSRRMA